MTYAKKFFGPRNKKRFSKGKKLVQKRYGKSFKKLNYNQLYADVMSLKSIINSEKKNIVVLPTVSSIGQVNANAEGALVLDITPQPAQGTGDSQRVGDSIKLTTGMFKFQISQMGSTVSRISVVLEIWKVLGTPQATSTVLNQLWLPTAFITGANIRDANAQPDQDYRQQYQLVSRRKFRLQQDTASSQIGITNVQIPLKFGQFGHYIKYAENSTTVASGQLMLTVRCDTGNINFSSASTLGNVINLAANTGAYMNKSMTFYYYDN